MTLWKILCGIAIGIAILGWLFYGVQGCSNKKVIESLNDEIKACQNAPVKVVTVIKHDTVHDTKWYTPKITHDTVHDTVKPKFCRQDYSDVYTFGRGDSAGSFTYNIHDRDCVPKINFSNFNYPVIHKTITKTILKDTCDKKVSLWDWEVSPGVCYNPFNASFGVRGEGKVSYRDIGLFTEIGATTKKDAEFKLGLSYTFHKKK